MGLYEVQPRLSGRRIDFGCNPERVDELKVKALEVIKQFVTEGVTEAVLCDRIS